MIPFPSLSAYAKAPVAVTSGIISSVQQVTVTIAANASSATATITSVDTTRSVVFWGGLRGVDTAMQFNEDLARVDLTNATTVTAQTNSANTTSSRTVRCTVVEFTAAAISRVQQGTVSIANNATSGTATITSVTTSRAAVLFLGQTVTQTGLDIGFSCARLTLTNATTVTATRGVSNATSMVVGYVVVEFASGVTTQVQQASTTIAAGSTSATSTLTSTATARTMLFWGGFTISASSTAITRMGRATLTNATTVTATRQSTSNGTTVNVTAVEFASAYMTSLQRGESDIAVSAASADVTVTSVATSRAVATYLGHTFATLSSNMDQNYSTLYLSGATNVKLEREATSTTALTTSWELAEFAA